MKKIPFIVTFLLVAGMFISTGAKAQVVIKVRPEWHEDPHYVRPPAPSPHHVWIDGEWKWDEHAHRYVHVPGYWVAERPGSFWVPGHWAAAPGGEEWIAGHWSRRGY